MAAASRFSKKSQESIFGGYVDQVLRSGDDRPVSQMNELDFIESPQGLNATLYPVQRVIVKAIFGIPMDYKQGMVPVWDVMHENLLYTFTECEYLKWKYDTGNCNVPDWRDIPEHGFNTADLYAGRRSGKSVVVSAIGSALARNLLMLPDPQSLYKLRPGSYIDFTMIGTDAESSNRLYDKMRSDMCGASFFTPFMKGNTDTEMTFVSEVDREREGVVPSIRVAAYPCTTNAIRGPSSYFLALDEFAFFRSSKDTDSEALYKAATPSTSNFPNPNDPDMRDSRVLLISSPGSRIGKMYDLHRQALKQGISSNIFTINCYTAEMNPGLPASALRDEFNQSPDSFPVEFGGRFREGSGSFVPEVQVEQCIDRGRLNVTRFTPDAVGRKYFWGLDLGMAKDATGLAIGHLDLIEGRGIELIIDYVDRMMVGEKFEGPGVVGSGGRDKYEDAKELRIEDILSWLVWMQQIFPCFQGATDQGGGRQLKQTLQINGIQHMELVHLTPQINSQMYFALRGFVANGSVRFPDVPKFITEFKMLEADYISKHQLKVEAPTEKGAHDDMSDCVALVAYLAQNWLDEEGHLDLDPSARVIIGDRAIMNAQPIIDPSAMTERDIRILGRMQRSQMSQYLPVGMVVQKDPYRRR